MSKVEEVIEEIVEESYNAYGILRDFGMVPILNEAFAKRVFNSVANVIGGFMEMYIELQNERFKEISSNVTESKHHDQVTWMDDDDVGDVREVVAAVKPISKKRKS